VSVAALALLVAAMVALVAWDRWQARPPGGPGRSGAAVAPSPAAAAGGERRRMPGAEAPAPRADAAVPADDGALPFGRDEKAAYRVTWRIGGAGGIDAGRATCGASAGAASRHFVLDVETTAWVASLFDARDHIETWTGADLLPLRQEQRRREGRRAIDRATRFDRASQTFSVDDGPPRPLPEGARDGLSALFYARTLPLAGGYAARVPVVEGGRVYEVDLRVVERVERLVSAGREVEAFRVTLGVLSLPDRREAARAALWLSTDRRRVPLALDIETAFGSFRAELERYERR
jgi:hypothetical protein